MQFSKWHGLGNTYLIARRSELDAPLAADRVRRLCADEESDGVVEIVSMTDDEADVVIWNPDGSTAEVSGNGTRIAARWLAERTRVREVTIRTPTREVRARMLAPPLVETDLGEYEVAQPEPLEIAGETVELVPVSVGNPHAIVRGDPADAIRLGPLIERHPRFPNRTNVQVVRVDGRHDVTIGIWERGAGSTPASGSSAAAVAAAAVTRDWCASPVIVHMRGGELEIRLEAGHVFVIGPAEPVA